MDKTTAFGLPLFYRIVLPGGIAVLLALPLLVRLLPQVGVRAEDVGTAVVVTALLIGFVLDALDDYIYKIYEGLRFWPPVLRGWSTARWQGLVNNRRERESEADPVSRGAMWATLSDFPVDAMGKPFASRPTRLGNILAAYEEYPYHRYGLDAIVFWPRLWLTLPKDVRDSVEQDQAAADALVHTAAAFVLVGCGYLVAGIASVALAARGVIFIFENDARAAAILGGVLVVVASVVPYVLSFGPLRRHGEAFRSAFDVYRGNLDKVVLPGAAEWKKWDQLGNDIQYAASPANEGDAESRA